MVFSYQQKVLFKHCDPAGIVFYPRYFEMMNDCVEAFFEEVLNWPFVQVHKKGAVPMVEISTEFTSPGRLGDQLQLALNITRIGRSSLGFSIQATCDKEPKFTTTATLVKVNEEGQAENWPDKIKEKLVQFMEGQK